MKIIIQKTMFIVLFTAAAATCSAGPQGPVKDFSLANDHYMNGEYEKAIDGYETIFKEGYRGFALFYDLGNSYFAVGDIGKAILNYEKARKYKPRDRDLVFNLEYVRSRMKQQDPGSSGPVFLKSIDRFFDYLTLNESVILIGILYYLVMGNVTGILFFRRMRALLAGTLVLLLICTGTGAVGVHEKFIKNNRSAIIISGITDARYEPDDGSDVHFPLFEGMKVYILREYGDWYKIMRPDKKIGWIDCKAAERI